MMIDWPTFLEQVDYVSARVKIFTGFGVLGGVGTALFKGHPMGRTVLLTAASCAMTSTALFTSERIATAAWRMQSVAPHSATMLDNSLRQTPPSPAVPDWEEMLTTYAMGGVLGGSMLGYLYIRRPLHGVLFFVPLMLLVGTFDKLFQDLRQERIQEYHKLKERQHQ